MFRVIVMTLLLAGCGTQASLEGQACGSREPISFRLADFKDRSAFDGRCRSVVTEYRPDGSVERVTESELIITSAESSTSTVIATQADALGKLAGAIAAGISPASISFLPASELAK